MIEVHAESSDSLMRNWVLTIDGAEYVVQKKSGEAVAVPYRITGNHLLRFFVDSPFSYRGYMDIEGRKLSFVVNETKAFQARISNASSSGSNKAEQLPFFQTIGITFDIVVALIAVTIIAVFLGVAIHFVRGAYKETEEKRGTVEQIGGIASQTAETAVRLAPLAAVALA